MNEELNQTLEIPASSNLAEESSPTTAPASIGGWLVLPAIGLVLSLVFTPISFLVKFVKATALSRDNGDAIVGIDLLSDLLLYAVVVYVATRFFRKRSNAPKMMIGLAIVSLAVNALCLTVSIGLDAETFILLHGKAVAGGVVGAAIWVPYFLVSKRVKRTFVVP